MTVTATVRVTVRVRVVVGVAVRSRVRRGSRSWVLADRLWGAARVGGASTRQSLALPH